MNSPRVLPSSPLNPASLIAAIVEGSQDAIIAQTPTGIVLTWNRGAERIYGFCAEEMIGKPIAGIVPPDKADELPRLYAELAAGHALQSIETARVRKDGRRIEISLTLSGIYDEHGKLIGFSSIARDVTARNQAIADDRRRQQLLTDFVENATEGLHWVGPDGVILWANKAELESLGYSAEEYIGHHISEFHADEPVICDILRRLTAGDKLHGYEARMRAKDGSIRHVLINSSVYFEAGKFVHTRCFTRDITTRKAIEEELRTAQEKLRQQAEELEKEVSKRTTELRQTVQSLEGMCYTMAHDLRSPLRTMQSFAQILVSEYGPRFDDEGRLYAERIVASANRMDQLIRDILEFARLSHTDVPTESVDLNEQALFWERHFGDEIQARGAQFKVQRPLPAVAGNRLLLEQVFTNLIMNALKFTSPARRPEIEITGHAEGGFAVVCVRDNGIGIAPEHRERIFGLFQRLHTSEQYPGTGLGLAIVRRAVDRMGGSVTVESDPDHGSTFRLRLPLAPLEA